MRGQGFTIMDVLLGLLLLSVILGAVLTAFSQITAASRTAQQRSLLVEAIRAASAWAWQNASRLPTSGPYTLSPSDWGEIQAGGKFNLPPGTTLTGELDLGAMRLKVCMERNGRPLRCEEVRQDIASLPSPIRPPLPEPPLLEPPLPGPPLPGPPLPPPLPGPPSLEPPLDPRW